MTEASPHLAFPFRIGPDGRTARVESPDAHVRDELVQLILTDPGERAYMPELGGGARSLIFEPIDEATRGMTKARITRAISNWLGHRVTIENVNVGVRNETIEVEIRYRLAGTDDARVLRFQRSGGAP